MDETELKHVVEAALLAAGRPLTLERLQEIFAVKGGDPDRATLKRALEALAKDYEGRGIELKEVATGYRVQVKRTMTDWLHPLWEERAPRYTRALLETLALVAYRQPITRAEIEEVRGVVVSTNIVRTLLERSWIRVVGYRDVPGKPAMFGTTKEFLEYFGLKKLEELPTLAEIKEGLPELSPQTDLLESLEADARGVDAVLSEGDTVLTAGVGPIDEPDEAEDESELTGADLLGGGEDSDDEAARAKRGSSDETDDEHDEHVQSAEVIPLRATEDDQ
ncbi:MAG TPA: SMC-Scp complex subunit ScpB [Gammaproteobacteria bacterium]|nr:SMC-Scp complex subunit ScpB [Gammaproteobacteria bacterium]